MQLYMKHLRNHYIHLLTCDLGVWHYEHTLDFLSFKYNFAFSCSFILYGKFYTGVNNMPIQFINMRMMNCVYSQEKMCPVHLYHRVYLVD